MFSISTSHIISALFGSEIEDAGYEQPAGLDETET